MIPNGQKSFKKSVIKKLNQVVTVTGALVYLV
jgi:hypothetical protein